MSWRGRYSTGTKRFKQKIKRKRTISAPKFKQEEAEWLQKIWGCTHSHYIERRLISNNKDLNNRHITFIIPNTKHIFRLNTKYYCR